MGPTASMVNSGGSKSRVILSLQRYVSRNGDWMNLAATAWPVLWLVADRCQSSLPPPSDNAAWTKIPDPRATAEEADPCIVNDFGLLNERWANKCRLAACIICICIAPGRRCLQTGRTRRLGDASHLDADANHIAALRKAGGSRHVKLAFWLTCCWQA